MSEFIYQVELSPYGSTPTVTRYLLIKETEKSVLVARPDAGPSENYRRRIFKSSFVHLFNDKEEALKLALKKAHDRRKHLLHKLSTVDRFIDTMSTEPCKIIRDGKY